MIFIEPLMTPAVTRNSILQVFFELEAIENEQHLCEVVPL